MCNCLQKNYLFNVPCIQYENKKKTCISSQKSFLY